jgi:hypothetical protein
MPRITNDLHNALVAISDHGECQASPIVFHRLELMGFIMYEFGGKWSITAEGMDYLLEVSGVNLNVSLRRFS